MNIRLKQEYLNFICHKSLELFNSKEVWIFGSRVDMNRWRYRPIYQNAKYR